MFTKELSMVGGKWIATLKRNGRVFDSAEFATKQEAENWFSDMADKILAHTM